MNRRKFLKIAMNFLSLVMFSQVLGLRVEPEKQITCKHTARDAKLKIIKPDDSEMVIDLDKHCWRDVQITTTFESGEVVEFTSNTSGAYWLESKMIN